VSGGKAETKRHHWIVRVTHWVNAIALTLMVGSGLRIFNAYPAFARRGERFCCYPFEHKAIPNALTFGGWLGGARHWHFALMWVLVVNGLVYLSFIYLHGEWRDLVPRHGDARDALAMIKFYLFVTPTHPRQGKHNAMQKATYLRASAARDRAGAHRARDLEARATGMDHGAVWRLRVGALLALHDDGQRWSCYPSPTSSWCSR